MDDLPQDLRYTFRVLRKSPAFALVAIVTIALGIGVNSTIFSLVNAVLLRPLPVEAPEQLIDVYGHTATSDDYGSSSYPNFMDYRAQSESLTGMMAYVNFFANLSIEGSSELVVGELVSEDYFSLLGVRPAIGRSFSPEEFSAPGAGPVAILGHAFWRSRFGSDEGVVGSTLRLNGTTYTIVGVGPESFGGMFPAASAQMWLPLSMVDEVEPIGAQRGSASTPSRLDDRGRHFLWVRGRMAPTASLAQVQNELQTISARLAEQYPETNEFERLTLVPTNDVSINPDFDRVLAPVGLVLLGAVGLVLLVACANLANMLLARASARRREVAVRIAMGAKRGRLIRQMMTESLVLALAGGLVAMLISVGLAKLVTRFQPPLPIDLGLDISPDWRVLLFTLVIACVTGVVFGLVPALRASRPDLVPALKDTGDGASTGRRVELRDALVVVQVAVSLVLLVSGALLVRSLSVAGQVDLGYDPDRVAYLGLALGMNGYSTENAGAFSEAGRLRMRALPQVEVVGMTSRVPLSLNNNGFGVRIDGHQQTEADAAYVVDGAYVDEHYLDALGLTLVAGRGIEAADRDGLRVAVVTETMAERYWPDGSAVGREFRTSWEGRPWRIVGIVEDYKVDTPGESPKPYLHLPLRRDDTFVNYVVRTSGVASAQVPALERELRSLDADLVFLETGALRDMAGVRLFPVRAGAWFIGAFGVLALLVAAVGLYGVIAYAVSRRVREIGIRMAMGAEANAVVALVLRQGMLLVGVGIGLGVVLAGLAARALSSVLFVGALDPLSFVAAAGALAAVALLANAIPALRAARVDPMEVLRAS